MKATHDEALARLVQREQQTIDGEREAADRAAKKRAAEKEARRASEARAAELEGQIGALMGDHGEAVTGFAVALATAAGWLATLGKIREKVDALDRERDQVLGVAHPAADTRFADVRAVADEAKRRLRAAGTTAQAFVEQLGEIGRWAA